MVSRNFRFDRGGILFKCFSLGIIFIRRSGTIPSLTCSRLRSAPNLVVVSLRTSSRIMPKKGKVTGGAQQSSDPLKLEREEGILSAISVTKGSQICLKILAKPGAKQSNVTDISADGVGIQIAAPAREGEANEELMRYLTEVLNVRKRCISLDKGSKSRQKVVMIDSAEITVEQVRERLSREGKRDQTQGRLEEMTLEHCMKTRMASLPPLETKLTSARH